jgi:F-type H+-transporting ATPase subunit a
MGRVTGGIRSAFRRFVIPGGIFALLAGFLFLAASVRAAKDEPGHDAHTARAEREDDHKERAGAADPKDEGAAHEGEHEPDALEHVMDEKDKWHLFHSFPPHSITLPHYTLHVGERTVTLRLTKFMILELVAAGLVAAIFIPIARRLRSGEPPKGGWLNAFEVLLTFIRDEVAKPAIGHDADKYVPFLWTMFLFILFTNLLGMIPFCGSATGNIYVTAGLALCVFFAIHGSGAAKMGFGHYVASMWPHFDVPYGLGYVLKPLIFVLEWMGVIVRNGVLALRLFANMFAGHVVLATILIFIYVAGSLSPALWGTITVTSVLGQVALSLLELFVAFLQAYIFTFLTSLFLGMALHPAH